MIFLKLRKFFEGITTDPNYKGNIMTDNMVLAVDTSPTQDADVDDFAVAYMNVTDRSSSLNPKEKTNSYYYHGESSIKTGNQRTIDFKADRYKGDEFQDFVASFEMKYATGQKSIVRYAYLDMLTGEGELGKGTLILSDDGSGAPEDPLSIGGSIKKSGENPTKLIYQGFGGYTLTDKEPADWSTKYSEYFARANGAFVAVKAAEGGSAPAWEKDKYYSKNTSEAASSNS